MRAAVAALVLAGSLAFGGATAAADHSSNPCAAHRSDITPKPAYGRCYDGIWVRNLDPNCPSWWFRLTHPGYC